MPRYLNMDWFFVLRATNSDFLQETQKYCVVMNSILNSECMTNFFHNKASNAGKKFNFLPAFLNVFKSADEGMKQLCAKYNPSSYFLYLHREWFNWFRQIIALEGTAFYIASKSLSG